MLFFNYSIITFFYRHWYWQLHYSSMGWIEVQCTQHVLNLILSFLYNVTLMGIASNLQKTCKYIFLERHKVNMKRGKTHFNVLFLYFINSKRTWFVNLKQSRNSDGCTLCVHLKNQEIMKREKVKLRQGTEGVSTWVSKSQISLDVAIVDAVRFHIYCSAIHTLLTLWSARLNI